MRLMVLRDGKWQEFSKGEKWIEAAKADLLEARFGKVPQLFTLRRTSANKSNCTAIFHHSDTSYSAVRTAPFMF